MSLVSGIQRIAHFSDVHLLGRRQASYDFRCRFVSLQRPLDATERARKFTAALRAALRSGAKHLVISGDLTEMGTTAEFEHIAELLHDAKVDPSAVTLVPGNHDVYTTPDGWRRALEGPLAAFAKTSAEHPGKVIDRGDLAIVPVDVTRHQSVARSGGELTGETADALDRCFADRSLLGKAVLVVQHHPPFSNPRSPWHFIDGLAGYARMLAAMAKHPNLQLLHGHTHQITDRVVQWPSQAMDRLRAGAIRLLPRVFSAPAVVEDELGRPRVRLYDLRDGRLESVGLAA